MMDIKPKRTRQPKPGRFTRLRSAARQRRELMRRRRELITAIVVASLFILVMVLEFKISRISSTLPMANSIFFFGLININIILLIAFFWLIFRNIGKLFLERRSKVLGARLKTKLVLAFTSLSVIPTLALFVISSLYINSSFDSWFSLKIRNTLEASSSITKSFYENIDRTTGHFARHIAENLGGKLADQKQSTHPVTQKWIANYLENQRNLLAIDAVEFYSDPFDYRQISQVQPDLENTRRLPLHYPRLPLDLLEEGFDGKTLSAIQHLSSGDLIRYLAPVFATKGDKNKPVGVVAVNTYIPISLVTKVGEIERVTLDYRNTNPLKNPLKTQYFVLLITITLIVMLGAIWFGFYLARQLTEPVERLVRGAKEVGAGNLNVRIPTEHMGQDEIAELVKSFNNMTGDLKENRKRLLEASTNLEQRKLELEAVLANVGTGVMVVDPLGNITTFNRAAEQLLELNENLLLGKSYKEVFAGESLPLKDLIEKTLETKNDSDPNAQVTHWHFKGAQAVRSLAGIATKLQENDMNWGAVVVVEDMSHLIKAQREVAWREVARRIAHEIKNPLTPIKLSAQRLQRRLGDLGGKDGALLRECTSTIVAHTDELKEMVNEFSNFARFPETSPAPHDLNQVLAETTQLFAQAHPNIEFETSVEEKLPVFEFDRDQLKRVFMNLLDNSVAACKSENGKDRIKKHHIRAQIHYNQQLEMAMVTISDNGPGMKEDIVARVFEPYFSTKAEGTGLGLAIAKRIINDHDGFIRVQTELGKGTQFLIELPTRVRHEMGRA